MIPKIIHYCWFGGKPLPESAVRCIESWKRFCPDYEIVEWNETSYDTSVNLYVSQAYESGRWGFVTDYARLDILSRCGGIYFDTDVEVIRSFDPLLSRKGFAGFQADCRIATGLGLGAEAHDPLIEAMMRDYDGRAFLRADGKPDLTPCTEFNSRVLAERGLRLDGRLQEIDGFLFLPQDCLCPKSFEDGKLTVTEHTYSIHHYEASWQTAQEKYRLRLNLRFRRFLSPRTAYALAAVIASAKYDGCRGLTEKLRQSMRRTRR